MTPVVTDPVSGLDMRSINSVIAGNSLAIMLTVVFVLPITALFAFSATAPLDDATRHSGSGSMIITNGAFRASTRKSGLRK